MWAAAVEPVGSAAPAALEEALSLMCRDDPSLTVTDEDGGLVLRGAGELHLEVACDRLRSDFGVKASLSRPRVALRESVEAPFEHSTEEIYDATLAGAAPNPVCTDVLSAGVIAHNEDASPELKASAFLVNESI